MANKTTSGNSFTSVRQSAADKAENTKKASLDIARDEAELRDEKTAKLRKARLEMEARQTEAKPDGD